VSLSIVDLVVALVLVLERVGSVDANEG